ncbi:MAG: DUF4239 domain-containing protein [Reyranellales bacterium]
MLDWLYNFPEPLTLALSAAFLATSIVFLPRLVRRVRQLAPSDANTDFIVRIQTPLFTMTSIALAFTLVQADHNFRQVDALVSTEAAQINQLDRLLARYGEDQANKVRPMLHTYARSIVKDEWPAMLRDRGNDGTGQAFTPISQRILSIEPSTRRQALIFAEMLKSLDLVAESRASRLNTLTVGLPAIYWEVILFAVAMLVFVTSTIEQTPFRSAVLGAQMAVLGAFVGFVFLMDQPFKGQTAVTPDALIRVISTMEARRE